MNSNTQPLIYADQDELVKSLRGLIQINSTSGAAGEITAEAPLGVEINRAINYLLDYGREFGFRTRNLDGYAGWIEMGPEDADEMIAIICHVDTVPVDDDWTYDPYDLTIVDGKMYGRGTNDDKGPAIAALYAMKALADAGVPLDRRVRLIVGGDEENGDWKCMKRYKETEEIPAYAFSPDAMYPVIYAEKGILHLTFKAENPEGDDIRLKAGSAVNIVPAKAEAEYNGETVKATGKAAHAMEPEAGDNALLKLGKILKEKGAEHPFLDLLEIANVKDLNIDISDEASGNLTFNPSIGLIDSETASLKSDIRYPVTANHEEIVEKIKAVVEPLGFQVIIDDYVEPLYVDRDSELVKTLVDVYNEATGSNTEAIAIGGGTYARAFDNAVAFGILFPGEPDMCHQTDEYWPVEDLTKNTEIIAKAISALANRNT